MRQMFFPHLSYCLTSWSQTTAISPMRMIYNKALKTLARKSIRTHHCKVLQGLEFLNFENVIKFCNFKWIYKFAYVQASAVLGQLTVPLQWLHHTRSLQWECERVLERYSPWEFAKNMHLNCDLSSICRNDKSVKEKESHQQLLSYWMEIPVIVLWRSDFGMK